MERVCGGFEKLGKKFVNFFSQGHVLLYAPGNDEITLAFKDVATFLSVSFNTRSVLCVEVYVDGELVRRLVSITIRNIEGTIERFFSQENESMAQQIQCHQIKCHHRVLD